MSDSLAPLVQRTAGLQPWRRVFHATNGLVLVGILAFLDPPRQGVVLLLTGLLAMLLTLDFARFRVKALNRLFFRVFSSIASPREAVGPASSTWYVAGALLTVALFPMDMAISAILVLALADPAASYMGRRWGRRPFGTGTVEGSMVFFVVAFGILLVQVGPVTAAAVALGTTLAERNTWSLDDNLVVPLTAGSLLWVATLVSPAGG
ncbi:MAG: hypothetical protein EA422_01605 [Gemmatimonadales bacterium]|nr:MAG: hypothetical protein EA422_01605 [Gemmatimonadales bacterium]